MGENHVDSWPAALYGAVLLCAGLSYFILARTLVGLHGKESVLAVAMGNDAKGKASLVLYGAAVPLAFVSAWIAVTLYVAVAIIWLVPDRRIERTLVNAGE